VSGVTTIHDPLSKVNSGAGDVGLRIQVGDFVDRSAMNTHADVNFGMTLQLFADRHRAKHRCFHIVPKHQRATITGR